MSPKVRIGGMPGFVGPSIVRVGTDAAVEVPGGLASGRVVRPVSTGPTYWLQAEWWVPFEDFTEPADNTPFLMPGYPAFLQSVPTDPPLPSPSWFRPTTGLGTAKVVWGAGHTSPQLRPLCGGEVRFWWYQDEDVSTSFDLLLNGDVIGHSDWAWDGTGRDHYSTVTAANFSMPHGILDPPESFSPGDVLEVRCNGLPFSSMQPIDPEAEVQAAGYDWSLIFLGT